MWQERLSEFVTLFIVVNSISALPTCIAVTAGFDPATQRKVALIAVLTSFAVLAAFIIAGDSCSRRPDGEANGSHKGAGLAVE